MSINQVIEKLENLELSPELAVEIIQIVAILKSIEKVTWDEIIFDKHEYVFLSLTHNERVEKTLNDLNNRLWGTNWGE